MLDIRTLKRVLPGLLYLLAGIVFLCIPNRVELGIEKIIGCICLISSLPFLWHGVTQRHSMSLIAFLLDFIFGIVCFVSGPDLISLLYTIYLCGIGVIYLIQWVLDQYNWVEGVPGFLYLLAGIYFLIWPKYVGLVFGVYLILQGVQSLVEALVFSSKLSSRYWSINHWISLPCFIVGVIPSFIVGYLQNEAMKNKDVHYDARKNDLPANVQVYIHTGTHGSTVYGHMTFAANGVMYSYGDYDVADEKLFKTIGPGIFFTADANLYSNNCCVIERSPLFEYGLHLSNDQLEKLQEVMEEVVKDTTPWQCDLAKLSPAEQQKQFPQYEKIYANRLWYRTRCKYRMYTKGKWHWYTLLGNNCSNWSASKLNEIGLNLPIQKSIVSPGEYYEVFETMFRDPDSCVVSRSWHSVDDPKTLFEVDGIQGYAGYDTTQPSPSPAFWQALDAPGALAPSENIMKAIEDQKAAKAAQKKISQENK